MKAEIKFCSIFLKYLLKNTHLTPATGIVVELPYFCTAFEKIFVPA